MPGFENFAGRQYPLNVYKRFRAADLMRIQGGAALSSRVIGYIVIPPKTLVTTAIQFMVTTALTTATGTIAFKDDADNSAIASKDLHSGLTTVALQAVGYVDSGRRIRVELTSNGATGAALDSRLDGAYVQEGRANEVAPERGDKIAAL